MGGRGRQAGREALAVYCRPLPPSAAFVSSPGRYRITRARSRVISPLPIISSRSDRIDLMDSSVSTTSMRSEEHTSELQSRLHLVCRLLLEKKNSALPA